MRHPAYKSAILILSLASKKDRFRYFDTSQVEATQSSQRYNIVESGCFPQIVKMLSILENNTNDDVVPMVYSVSEYWQSH